MNLATTDGGKVASHVARMAFLREEKAGALTIPMASHGAWPVTDRCSFVTVRCSFLLPFTQRPVHLRQVALHPQVSLQSLARTFAKQSCGGLMSQHWPGRARKLAAEANGPAKHAMRGTATSQHRLQVEVSGCCVGPRASGAAFEFTRIKGLLLLYSCLSGVAWL